MELHSIQQRLGAKLFGREQHLSVSFIHVDFGSRLCVEASANVDQRCNQLCQETQHHTDRERTS